MADYEEIELNPEEELGFRSLPTTHSDVHTNTNSPSLHKQTNKKITSPKQKRPKLSYPGSQRKGDEEITPEKSYSCHGFFFFLPSSR